MNKICLLILISVINFSSFGQTYKPMLSNTSEWFYYVEGLQIGTFIYTIEGDTTFNGFQHSIISHYYTPKTTPSHQLYLREDSLNRIVYMADYLGNDSILYDFNLLPGDTFQKSLTLNGGYAQLILDSISNDINSIPLISGSICTSIDSINTNLSPLKIFHFDKDVWIEGIGSIRDLIYNDHECFKNLTCHFDQNTNKDFFISVGYGSNYLSDECVTDISLGIESSNNSTIIISPNPTTGRFSVNLDKVKQDVKATLTNSLGQVILTQQFESTNIINLVIDAPAGIYFLQLELNNSETKTIKVLKE